MLLRKDPGAISKKRGCASTPALLWYSVDVNDAAQYCTDRRHSNASLTLVLCTQCITHGTRPLCAHLARASRSAAHIPAMSLMLSKATGPTARTIFVAFCIPDSLSSSSPVSSSLPRWSLNTRSTHCQQIHAPHAPPAGAANAHTPLAVAPLRCVRADFESKRAKALCCQGRLTI